MWLWMASPLAAMVALAGCGDDDARPASAGPVSVYAATSLTAALKRLDPRPRYSFGASNTLQLQIERGAPADLFLAASPEEAQTLHAKGRCDRPQTLATNRLVLIVPEDDPAKVRSVEDLRRGGLRLSIGNAGVPIGDYARRLLRRLGLAAVLDRNDVSEQANAGQVLAQVAFGGAEAGFVYATDARTQPGRVDVREPPRRAQPPVRYVGCVVRRPGANRAGAAALLEELRGPRGRTTLRRFGFGLPAR